MASDGARHSDRYHNPLGYPLGCCIVQVVNEHYGVLRGVRVKRKAESGERRAEGRGRKAPLLLYSRVLAQ